MFAALSRSLIWPFYGLIKLYQWTLSPYLGHQCRFLPTCSNYALEALSKHGVWRGGWLTLRRLGRCHPWGGAGLDPVPEPRGRRASHTDSASHTDERDLTSLIFPTGKGETDPLPPRPVRRGSRPSPENASARPAESHERGTS